MRTDVTDEQFLPADPGERFVERGGGMVVSLAFHVALFLLLLNWTIEPPKPPMGQEEAIRIELNNAMPEAAAETAKEQSPAEEPAESVLPPQPQATVADTDPTEKKAELVADEVADTFEDVAEQAKESKEEESDEENATETMVAGITAKDITEPTEEVPEPTMEEVTEQAVEEEGEPPTDELTDAIEKMDSRQRQALQEALEQQHETLETYNQKVAKSGSARVADRLRAAEVELQAKKWLTTTRGIENGAIRSLDLVNADPAAADAIRRRYDIRITYKYIDQPSGSYGFLNQAETSSGTYVNKVGKGVFEVLSYPYSTLAYMMRLETQAIRDRGLDPAKTRVVEVVYGPVSTGRQFDLGIKSIELAPVEFDE